MPMTEKELLQRRLERLREKLEEAGLRVDANETMFLNRQIEHVRAKVFSVRYATNLARSFIPMATDIPAWASHVIEIIYDSTGQAKFAGNNTDDAPRVDGVASEQSFKVYSLKAAYGFSLMDLRQALATGVPLSDRKAMMSRRVIETAIDEILCKGNLAGVAQDVGLKGLANLTGVGLVTSDAAGTSWVNGTADEMLGDIHKLVQKPGEDTKQIYETTDLLIPIREWNIISKKRATTLSSQTVLQCAREQLPGVNFQKWNRLDSVLTAGTGRLIAYHKSPEVVEGIVSQEYEQLPPQVRNYETVINCHARVAGCRVHQPKGLAYMDLDASQV